MRLRLHIVTNILKQYNTKTLCRHYRITANVTKDEKLLSFSLIRVEQKVVMRISEDFIFYFYLSKTDCSSIETVFSIKKNEIIFKVAFT